MEVKPLINRIMKGVEIKLLKYNSHLFDYSIENLNSTYFIDKKVWILNDNPDFNSCITKLRKKCIIVKHLKSIEDSPDKDTPENEKISEDKLFNELDRVYNIKLF